MGCKARHPIEISQRVFELMRNETSVESMVRKTDDLLSTKDGLKNAEMEKDNRCKSVPFELYKRRTTVVVRRETFLDVVCSTLVEYNYVGLNQRADLVLACRAHLVQGGRLGVTIVVPTNSLRHMMRSFMDEKQNSLAWASTYHAGEYLDPVAVVEAKAKRKAKKKTGICCSAWKYETSDGSTAKEKPTCVTSEAVVAAAVIADLISAIQIAIGGFKAQSEMVIESLDRLITGLEEQKESVIIEGIHLSLNFVIGLMKEHPSIIPFMIYIANEENHMERFAVCAKQMTLDPAKNKYVKYFQNIRTIQDYFCN